jgi:hypothetical protein
MSIGFTEDEMRKTLGLDTPQIPSPSPSPSPSPQSTPMPADTAQKAKPVARPLTKSKSRRPKLRVTLRVSKVFEGESTVFTHDADTLSHFDAEQQAKVLAKKEKYQYADLLSIKVIE